MRYMPTKESETYKDGTIMSVDKLMASVATVQHCVTEKKYCGGPPQEEKCDTYERIIETAKMHFYEIVRTFMKL